MENTEFSAQAQLHYDRLSFKTFTTCVRFKNTTLKKV